MTRVRVFYVVTLKENGKKKDLKRFFQSQWLPLLKSIPECQEVQLLEDFHNRAGYYLTEVWESPEAHQEWNRQLFSGQFQPLMKELAKIAMIEFAWSGTIVEN